MYNEKDLPKRKSTRLKNFDYGSAGAYFVTICIYDRMRILSEIVKSDYKSIAEMSASMVGEEYISTEFAVELKPCGEVVKEQLQMIEERFQNIKVVDYVIMPDHIHAIILLHNILGENGTSITLNDAICTFKSLTARNCKQRFGIEKMFQRSYAEHIIRDNDDYATRRRYIYENPMRWYYKYSGVAE